MSQKNYFVFQNDNERSQRIGKGIREVQKVKEIIDITSQNHLDNLKNLINYSNSNQKQKITRIVGEQANMMINALKSGLSLFYKDSSIGGISILDVYVDGKEYDGQYIKNLKI